MSFESSQLNLKRSPEFGRKEWKLWTQPQLGRKSFSDGQVFVKYKVELHWVEVKHLNDDAYEDAISTKTEDSVDVYCSSKSYSSSIS